VSEPSSAQVVLAAFAAVEQRDDAAFALACQPDAEFCWPPSLPYGGTVRGRAEGTGAVGRRTGTRFNPRLATGGLTRVWSPPPTKRLSCCGASAA
jgi:ketosteroid isomerase-like protein